MAYLCAAKVFNIFFIVFIIDKSADLSIKFLLKRAFFMGCFVI